MGGVETPILPWFWLGGEFQLAYVPNILGEQGVSAGVRRGRSGGIHRAAEALLRLLTGPVEWWSDLSVPWCSWRLSWPPHSCRAKMFACRWPVSRGLGRWWDQAPPPSTTATGRTRVWSPRPVRYRSPGLGPQMQPAYVTRRGHRQVLGRPGSSALRSVGPPPRWGRARSSTRRSPTSRS